MDSFLRVSAIVAFAIWTKVPKKCLINEKSIHLHWKHCALLKAHKIRTTENTHWFLCKWYNIIDSFLFEYFSHQLEGGRENTLIYSKWLILLINMFMIGNVPKLYASHNKNLIRELRPRVANADVRTPFIEFLFVIYPLPWWLNQSKRFHWNLFCQPANTP